MIISGSQSLSNLLFVLLQKDLTDCWSEAVGIGWTVYVPHRGSDYYYLDLVHSSNRILRKSRSLQDFCGLDLELAYFFL